MQVEVCLRISLESGLFSLDIAHILFPHILGQQPDLHVFQGAVNEPAPGDHPRGIGNGGIAEVAQLPVSAEEKEEKPRLCYGLAIALGTVFYIFLESTGFNFNILNA